MGVPRNGFDRALKKFYDYIDQKGAYAGLGTIPSVTGLSVSEDGAGPVRKTTLTFTNMAVTLADEAGVVAYGGRKVYDFPEGNVLVLGATLDGALTKSSAGVNANWDGDVSVGTVTASNNASLSSTEADIIPSTATPQAVAGATTCDAINTAVAFLDGTATAKDVFLNFLVDDADHDVTATPCNLIVNGTLTIHWINLGDK